MSQTHAEAVRTIATVTIYDSFLEKNTNPNLKL